MLHPLWAINRLLTETKKFEFPSDMKLLPEHCAQLYDAMAKADESKEMKDLSPEKYFQKLSDPCFNISMRDARGWELELKKYFCCMSYNTQKKVLQDIIQATEKACSHIENQLTDKSESNYLTESILPMARSLQKADMLPCIVFHMIRDNCVRFATALESQLRKEEEQAHLQDGHADKVAKQEKKVESLMKQLEKEGWNKDKDAGEEMTDEQKELMQDLALAESKLAKLKAVDPRFALIPPGQVQVTPDEIDEMVATGFRRKYFNPKDPLHLALLRGIGVHHAGLSKKYRRAVERLFRMKRLAIVVSTETLAMGINMPTKTSVFAGDSLFLNAMTFRQMAGRSGRRGFDLRGNVVFMGLRREKIQRLLNSELPCLSGNMLLTATYVLRMLVKHASIRTLQEAEIIAQRKKGEGFIDQVEDQVKVLLDEWRSSKSLTVSEEEQNRLAKMSDKERATLLEQQKTAAMTHINSRDLVRALLEMPEATRDSMLQSVVDDRSQKQKQLKDSALETIRFASAAAKKLQELIVAAEKSPAADAERVRVEGVRNHNAEAVARMVNLPLFSPNGSLMAKQYAFAFRFAAEYLQLEGLLDNSAAPRDVACIMAGEK
eukprot:753144-Hanusia_phi.AAC.3